MPLKNLTGKRCSSEITAGLPICVWHVDCLSRQAGRHPHPLSNFFRLAFWPVSPWVSRPDTWFALFQTGVAMPGVSRPFFQTTGTQFRNGGSRFHEMGQPPRRMGLTPSNMGPSFQQLGATPWTMGNTPPNAGVTPQRVGNPPHDLGLTPRRLGVAPDSRVFTSQSTVVTPPRPGNPPHGLGRASNTPKHQQNPMFRASGPQPLPRSERGSAFILHNSYFNLFSIWLIPGYPGGTTPLSALIVAGATQPKLKF